MSKTFKSRFVDGITDIINNLANTRNAINNNKVTHSGVQFDELRAIYKTGIGSKIVRLKSGYALKDTLQFKSLSDEVVYKNILEKKIKSAVRFMLGFGRGVIVLYNKGEDMSTPARGKFDPKNVEMKVFSGDMVTAINPSLDLMDSRYFMPKFYAVRGVSFHHSRVIDFTYVEPTEYDKAMYQYGGISEFEFIYSQLINDSIVERATPTILEKNSTLFYKVAGLKDAMMSKTDSHIKEYFSRVETARSIYGAGLLDAEDDAFTVNQTLTNLADADGITLRRLAMVTGIPMAVLVGENVKGLNSSGDNEMRIFQDTIEVMQEDYLKEPINQLFSKLGLDVVEFKLNQGRTPEERIEFETKVILNAKSLWELGEDHTKYLEENAVVVKDKFDSFFPEVKDEEEEPVDTVVKALIGEEDA